MPIVTTPDHWQITRDSIERALETHLAAGLLTAWFNWHEDRPARKRPLYTVTLAGPGPSHVIDLATLHEAHALCAGLASAEYARTKTVGS